MKQHLSIDGRAVEYSLRREGDAVTLELDGREVRLEGVELAADGVSFRLDGRRVRFDAVQVGSRLHLTDGGAVHRVERSAGGSAEVAAPQGRIMSQMPGTVLAVLVEAGARVEVGAPLVILEAMKMEHTLNAPAAGVVLSVGKTAGQRVMPGELLVELELEA